MKVEGLSPFYKGYRPKELICGHFKRLEVFITEFGSFLHGMGVIDVFICRFTCKV